MSHAWCHGRTSLYRSVPLDDSRESPTRCPTPGPRAPSPSSLPRAAASTALHARDRLSRRESKRHDESQHRTHMMEHLRERPHTSGAATRFDTRYTNQPHPSKTRRHRPATGSQACTLSLYENAKLQAQTKNKKPRPVRTSRSPDHPSSLCSL